MNTAEPVKLGLVPQVGRKDVTQYHSRAVNRLFKEGALLKKIEDVLDFKIQSKVLSVNPMANEISFRVKTLEKQGKGDLNEFAFPNLGEVLNLKLNSYSEVIDAGKFPKNSIFYVPTIPLPKTHVSIGDSWLMEAKWVSQAQKFPLKIGIVSILKSFQDCGASTCALVELNGDVELDGIKEKDLKLNSEIRGYMLFAIETGTVVWSYVHSEQKFFIGDVRNEMQSCLVSYLVKPKVPKLSKKVSPFCDPEKSFPMEDVPKLQ